MSSRVSYLGAGGVVDTGIPSSTVTAMSVTSSSGAPGDIAPATMGYGQTFYTMHLSFRDGNGRQLWFSVTFHDCSGCLGEDVDLDKYSAAVVGYGNSLGGSVTSVQAANDSNIGIVSRDCYNAILLLSEEALFDYAFTQARCDVKNSPVWTEAGYSMCSDVVSDVTERVGDIMSPASFPNVTTSVIGTVRMGQSFCSDRVGIGWFGDCALFSQPARM